jgi:hypothetical protein
MVLMFKLGTADCDLQNYMWTKLKSLFSNKITNTGKIISADFEHQVKQAIYLFENSQDLTTDDEAINYLIKNGIGNKEANEIIIFLPIAFVRHWLLTVKWIDTYLEYVDEKRSIEKKYSENHSYQVIWKLTKEYFANKPNRDAVLKIAGRSAEFNAINKFLNDNPNCKIEDIQLSPTVIMR